MSASVVKVSECRICGNPILMFFSQESVPRGEGAARYAASGLVGQPSRTCGCMEAIIMPARGVPVDDGNDPRELEPEEEEPELPEAP